MNTVQWETETDMMYLLKFERVCKSSRRKLAMFALACLREYELDHKFRDWTSAMSACEATVEGVKSIPKWECFPRDWTTPRHADLGKMNSAIEFILVDGFLAKHHDNPHSLHLNVDAGIWWVAEALTLRETQRLPTETDPETPPDHPANAVWERVQHRQADLLRDVYGPEIVPAFDPAWRTSTAVGVATGIYEDRAFDRMPILADAIQDAGCEDEAILSHCRGDGPHVRGCWVVDLVLGKE